MINGVLCKFSLSIISFLSPSIHNMDNFKSDKFLLMVDNFIDVDDNFQLKDY